MSLLFAYLRKSWRYVLLIIVLLACKVVADLSLPYFTSTIVNVGIQQGGISSPVPLYMSETAYEELASRYGDLITDSYEKEGEIYLLTENESDKLTGLFISEYAGENLPDPSLTYLSAIDGVKQLYLDAGIDLQDIQIRFILSKGLLMILITLASAAASIGVSYFASNVAAETGRDLREKVFNKVLSFHQREIDTFGTPTLITRSTNDITQIQNSLIMVLRVVFMAPLMGIGGIIQVFATGTPLTWTIALAVVVLLIVVAAMFRLVMPKFRQMQLLVDKINGVLRESLKGLLVIRAFSKQQKEIDRFEQTNEEATSVNLFVNRVMSAMRPIMMLIMNLTAVLIVYAGSSLVLTGEMQVGDIMAFIQYSMMIIMSFLMISMLSIMLPRAAISAQRISEILDTDSSITDGDQEIPQQGLKGVSVEFSDVSFTFPGAESEALSHITCSLPAGTVTGLIGSTGSGKSTLLNLIPRFLEPDSGTIRIDGNDISKLKLSSLRRYMGLVPQQSYLFSGTIADNISFPSHESDEERIISAAEDANASSFIEEKEDGYRSSVTSSGTNLSGGQRQRVAIARALFTHAPLLMFDDSFSAVDSRTEHEIKERLRQQHKGATKIIVSQKISTIRESDSIIVLDEGKIVSQGTHEELMKTCTVYQEIAYSQSSAKEVTA